MSDNADRSEPATHPNGVAASALLAPFRVHGVEITEQVLERAVSYMQDGIFRANSLTWFLARIGVPEELGSGRCPKTVACRAADRIIQKLRKCGAIVPGEKRGQWNWATDKLTYDHRDTRLRNH